ncbi:hypothetical protein ACFQ6H_21220 [Rhodococcus sp. NPDC056506]|uniref:hypothetical protein n=1 Tax=Rhodococcus sp. NPDC056506 TaxID=3345844 RepID=UPI00366F9908
MTDPGLTDLIAVALGDKIMHTNGSGDRNRAYAAHVALVVEQHTNGRMTELEARVDEWSAEYRKGIRARDNWRARAEKAEATIARVEKLANDMRGWCSPHGVSLLYSDRIREVLEWTELAAVGVTRVD